MLFEQIFQMFWLCPVASLKDDAPLQLLLWEILPFLGEKTKQGKVGYTLCSKLCGSISSSSSSNPQRTQIVFSWTELDFYLLKSYFIIFAIVFFGWLLPLLPPWSLVHQHLVFVAVFSVQEYNLASNIQCLLDFDFFYFFCHKSRQKL